jgi:hypothetical protein
LLLAASRNASASDMASQLAVRQTAGSLSFATVSSSNKTDVEAIPGRGKMRPLSVRFLPVLKLDSATSPLLLLCVGSFAKLAASRSCRQDGVQISLTEQSSLAASKAEMISQRETTFDMAWNTLVKDTKAGQTAL